MTPSPNRTDELDALIGRLLNDDLDRHGRDRLNDLLAGDVDAQKHYIHCLDLEAAIRTQAQSQNDDDFALLEVQSALDSQFCSTQPAAADASARNEKSQRVPTVSSASPPQGHRVAWTIAAATILLGLSITTIDWTTDSPKAETPGQNHVPSAARPYPAAKLSGAVGARWAGAKLDIPEDELFPNGQRLELVEGLAELTFRSGARVVVQGPAILQIRDGSSAWVSVGRVAALVPASASPFVVRTQAADLTTAGAEFGAEVDVDGSLVTQVYDGNIELKLNDDLGASGISLVAKGQGLRVDAASGRVGPLAQPNRLRFVRYLAGHELHFNLADVVAGGDGLAGGEHQAYHHGIALLNGTAVDNYGVPAVWDGQYHKAKGFEFIDGVFIPDGKRGPVQVDSIGRVVSEFPPTAGDCWGGAIMARRPKEEKSLPRIRLEFHGDNYGYVNWLHIASKPEELCPQGFGLIGMHSNCGITFDLHAIRARHPHKKLVRFRSLVGNLESKLEAYTADAWVLVDGQIRYRRRSFSREAGPEEIDIPLTDRDRFLVLVVTDAGSQTAYDWVTFGDPVIEMTNQDEISADADFGEGTHTRVQDVTAERVLAAASPF
jgi:hypothetical protein